MAISVSQRWHDAARLGSPRAGGGSIDGEPGNPFVVSGGGGGGDGGKARSRGSGAADSNPFLAGGSSAGGAPNPFMSPRGARGPSGAGNGVQMDTGSLTRSLLAAGGGPGAASEAAAAMLGSLLEGASQVRRAGALPLSSRRQPGCEP
jgi:hypothetical protein